MKVYATTCGGLWVNDKPVIGLTEIEMTEFELKALRATEDAYSDWGGVILERIQDARAAK